MSANDQAFPSVDPTWYDEIKVSETHIPGLTKRELFAALAFQGLLANCAEPPFVNPETDPSVIEHCQSLAFVAVAAANALIAALEATSERL